MAIQRRQELISGTLNGKRVSRRPEAVEVVVPVLVGAELAAEVVGLLVLGVLEVVFSVRGRLPDIHDGVGDGFACVEVSDAAVHQAGATVVRAAGDGVAVLTEGGVRAPEGAQDCGGCGASAAVCCHEVGDFGDQTVILVSFKDINCMDVILLTIPIR